MKPAAISTSRFARTIVAAPMRRMRSGPNIWPRCNGDSTGSSAITTRHLRGISYGADRGKSYEQDKPAIQIEAHVGCHVLRGMRRNETLATRITSSLWWCRAIDAPFVLTCFASKKYPDRDPASSHPHCSFSGTTSTEQGASRITVSATLPSASRARPDRPCVPTTTTLVVVRLASSVIADSGE